MSGEKSKSRESLNHKDEEKVALKDAEIDGDTTQIEDPLDSSKVQFINGGTTEARVNIDGQTKVQPEFTGLTKDELMKFADDPFWVKTRWILLILFWVAWVAMLAAAIAIIIVAPKCPPRPKQDWWQKSTVYSVYPKSFKDTDGNGYGDLKGVHDNLEHFRGLNATIVYLNSIYPSSGTDSGYDINDFKAVDKLFGSLEEVQSLSATMHKKGMKLVMDFVPNHSGKNHTWFKESQKKTGDYADYYIWRAGQSGGPPNNWKNAYNDPAWTLDPVRGEYYYHRFLSSQPDLNLRNPAVQQEMEDVLSFWMEHGVDGFHVDAAAHLVEAEDDSADGNAFQPETYELITLWRQLLDTKGEEDGKPKLLMVDAAGTTNQTAQFYKYEDMPGAHMATNKALLTMDENCHSQCVSDKVNSWISDLGQSGLLPNWQTGNRDVSRLPTRLNGEKYTDAMSMLLLTLPGTAVTYYGEEIGMHDVPGADAGALLSRDQYRTPLQWDDSENAGFSTGTPWLPVAGDYKTRNIKTQQSHGSSIGSIEVYRAVSVLRSEPSFQWGEFNSNVKDSLFYYTRQAEGFDGFLVAINFGTTPSTIDFTSGDLLIPNEGKVAASTMNFGDSVRRDAYAKDVEIGLTSVHLQPAEGVIARWPAKATPPAKEA